MFLLAGIINIPLYHQITHNEKADNKFKSFRFITGSSAVCIDNGRKLPVSTKKERDSRRIMPRYLIIF
jgi:hypothetical protein